MKALRSIHGALRTTGAFYEAKHTDHAGKNVSSGEKIISKHVSAVDGMGLSDPG